MSDRDGNTPLHCLNDLLVQNLIREASTLALLLLKAGGDINVVNNEGRTLLSYAVAVPEAEKLVHLLLDYGALVWPSRVCTIAARKNKEEDVVESLIREREESAFTWFIKSTLKHCEIRPGHLKILYLLCHSMSEEEGDPRRMKRRVLSTMIHYGRSYRVMGPIFSQLKRIISPFWTQPQPLKYLCKRKIRKAVGGGSVPRDLYLPKSLRDYLELERTEF
uniref:Putative LOC100166615 [Acyrthosiphon pisum] n=2 Tax=Lepeophtheirus salmonis TaxID=72036 RepID=A0A0K2VB96_LEPSM